MHLLSCNKPVHAVVCYRHLQLPALALAPSPSLPLSRNERRHCGTWFRAIQSPKTMSSQVFSKQFFLALGYDLWSCCMPCLVFPVRKKEAETLFPVMLSRKLSYSSGSPNGETTYVSQAACAYVLRSVIYVYAPYGNSGELRITTP